MGLVCLDSGLDSRLECKDSRLTCDLQNNDLVPPLENTNSVDNQVEIFRFVENENTLQYIKAIKHELLLNVNDIVAVGTESFYATNDLYFTNGILKFVEPFLSLPWCDVVYYSPQTLQVVAGGFLIANGIKISPDKSVTNPVHELPISLTLEVDVGSVCDNIEVDHESGDLWLSCHPNGLKFMLSDPNDPPGSEVRVCVYSVHVCSKQIFIKECVFILFVGNLTFLFFSIIYCLLSAVKQYKSIIPCSPVGYQD
uniref:Paraoxonase n=1 Tax=Sinocyclocheilus grahami TaxID=75366 RepID=A0A672QTI6_SINGR